MFRPAFAGESDSEEELYAKLKTEEKPDIQKQLDRNRKKE